MKLNIANSSKKLLSVGTMAVALIMASQSFAGSSKVFRGEGQAFSSDGQLKGTYQVETTVKEIDAQSSQSVTKVTMPDGTTKTIEMSLKGSEKGFKIDSSLGQGGGACYGYGLCESYIQSQQNADEAYATTIVEDAAGSRRHLTIVLKGGKAVEILSEKVNLVK